MFRCLVTRSATRLSHKQVLRLGNAQSIATFNITRVEPVSLFYTPNRFYCAAKKDKPEEHIKEESASQEEQPKEENDKPKDENEKTKEEDAEKIEEEDTFAADEVEEDFEQFKEPVHPYSISSGSVFYEGPLTSGAKILKRMSITGCVMTTSLSPMITLYGDPSIPFAARLVYTTVVFGIGLASTGVVHMFVTPYVVRMKLLKDEFAKTEADIPVKDTKKQKPVADGSEENVDGTESNVEDEEDLSEEEIEDEDVIEEPEIYDLTGYSIEYTTLSIIGTETTRVTEVDGIRPATNAIGTTNYITKEGDHLFIHEDYFASEGHEWFIRHAKRQRPTELTPEEIQALKEKEKAPESEEPTTKE